MKRGARRLHLNRETLRALADPRLRQVAAGDAETCNQWTCNDTDDCTPMTCLAGYTTPCYYCESYVGNLC